MSVRDAREAMIALESGADVIDVKEPARGALGAPTPHVIREVHHAIRARCTMSVVIGDMCDVAVARAAARTAVEAGADIVKIGFAGVRDIARACRVAEGTADGADGQPIVIVAYADAMRAGAPAAEKLLEVAARAGAAGFLLDTYDKHAGSLFAVFCDDVLVRLIARAHALGLFAGLAGSLGLGNVHQARALGADLFGVRGGACRSTRSSELCGARVRMLADACARQACPA